jgi:hypothetical protein
MSLKSKEVRMGAQAFVDAATRVTKAGTAEEFFEALREGYLYLHSKLTRDDSGVSAAALRQAFTSTSSDPGVKMALEMCAMPIYEKPLVPSAGDSPPEFLWVFTLPVVIRFPAEVCDEGPFVWDQDPLPAEDLLAVMRTSGRFAPEASLRVFTKLYTRADVLAWGPENLALTVVNAEISEAEAPFPLPIQFSSELSGYRSVMFFALCVARVPVGSKSLLLPQDGRADLESLAALIQSRLALLNIPVEEVTVAPPCPVTSSCFVSNPAFLQQVSEICEVSHQTWDLSAAYVKFPMPGYVEIAGRLPSGNEVILMPPELCCEPQREVGKALERVMAAAGLPVAGSFSSLHSQAAQLH